MGIRKVLALVGSDLHRLHEFSDKPNKPHFLRKLVLLSRPEILPLALYRWSHYFYTKKWDTLSGFLYRLNICLTGSDIHPRSTIGASALMLHPGNIIDGHIGDRVIFLGQCIIQPAFEHKRWSEQPCIGNDCTLGLQSMVIGDVRVPDGVTIAPKSLIAESVVPANSKVRWYAGESPIISSREKDLV